MFPIIAKKKPNNSAVIWLFHLFFFTLQQIIE